MFAPNKQTKYHKNNISRVLYNVNVDCTTYQSWQAQTQRSTIRIARM